MKASIDNIYAVILAAGASSRMGQPKPLLIWKNQPLLEHAIAVGQSVLPGQVIVVLGAQAESIQATVNLEKVTTIINHGWREGVASSIRSGVKALPSTAEAALILLCDTPLIQGVLIQNLLCRWQNEPKYMVACQYQNSVGVPALFPARYFGLLQELKGDQGAKKLLLKYSDKVIKIPAEEAALDIDTLSGFNHFIRQY